MRHVSRLPFTFPPNVFVATNDPVWHENGRRLAVLGHVCVIPKQIDLIIATVWYDRTSSHMSLTRGWTFRFAQLQAMRVTNSSAGIYFDQCYVDSNVIPEHLVPWEIGLKVRHCNVPLAMTDRSNDVIAIIEPFQSLLVRLAKVWNDITFEFFPLLAWKLVTFMPGSSLPFLPFPIRLRMSDDSLVTLIIPFPLEYSSMDEYI